jgi:hypothetical protein
MADAGQLLPGETLVASNRANALVLPTDYGLSRFPFDQYMGLIGMKGSEAVGGSLYLTSMRLIFQSHSINRLKGRFSIFFPSISAATDVSHLITRKVRIDTASQSYEFIMWGIPAFLSALESQRATFASPNIDQLMQEIAACPDAVGDGLEVSRGIDALVTGSANLADIIQKANKGAGLISSLINLADLLPDRTN